MSRKLGLSVLMVTIVLSAPVCAGWLPGRAEQAVTLLTEPVFAGFYDIPVSQSLYGSEGQWLEPGNPLEGTGSSTPKAPLGQD